MLTTQGAFFQSGVNTSGTVQLFTAFIAKLGPFSGGPFIMRFLVICLLLFTFLGVCVSGGICCVVVGYFSGVFSS